jgi:hypothetical protein
MSTVLKRRVAANTVDYGSNFALTEPVARNCCDTMPAIQRRLKRKPFRTHDPFSVLKNKRIQQTWERYRPMLYLAADTG